MNTDVSCKVNARSETKRSYSEYMDSSIRSLSFSEGSSTEVSGTFKGVTLGASRSHSRKEDSDEELVYEVHTPSSFTENDCAPSMC